MAPKPKRKHTSNDIADETGGKFGEKKIWTWEILRICPSAAMDAKARERMMNAIRRLEQNINPAFVHLVNDADILVSERNIGMPRENRKLDLRDG
jgi:hypothetical protein